jgi:uncharacterized protein (DUF427 family)
VSGQGAREPAGPGEESVWDYPRPPRLEPFSRRIEIVFNGETIADTRGAYRVLETSHPPVYYLPPGDLLAGCLSAAPGESFCEWKGAAKYCTVRVRERMAVKVGWYYPRPTVAFAAIAGYVAFYAAPMDECRIDGERVEPQPGGFYGGWITRNIRGPYKGGPGTMGW